MTDKNILVNGLLPALQRVQGSGLSSSSSPMSCVFCSKMAAASELLCNNFAAAFPDSYPISNGHTLVVPKRHEPDYFALSASEQAAVFELVGLVKGMLDKQYRPDGYNLGLNSGQAAGQTVLHAHLHIIPRYAGDVTDPRGGVRWVLPDRARYW